MSVSKIFFSKNYFTISADHHSFKSLSQESDMTHAEQCVGRDAYYCLFTQKFVKQKYTQQV